MFFLKILQAHHIYICDFHKGRIQCARTKRRRKDSEDDSNETGIFHRDDMRMTNVYKFAFLCN